MEKVYYQPGYLVWLYITLDSIRLDYVNILAGKGQVGRKVVFALAGNYYITLGCCCQELGGNVCLRHSLRLNADVVARAWLIVGSIVVRVHNILMVLILAFMCIL